MANYTLCAPNELPTSIHEAFEKEGFDPLVVFISQKKNGEEVEEITFVRHGVSVDGPTEFTASDLEVPHVTVQATKLPAPSSCWHLWCTRVGCFWIPYPC